MLGVEGGSTEGFLAGFSLETLIAPFDLDVFLNSHWDCAPLAVRRSLPDFYQGLTSVFEIDAGIAAAAFRMSYVDAPRQHGRTWISDRDAPDRPATDVLLARMAEGATLILDGAETVLPGLGRMCRLLMVETGHPWHCNIYATPPGGQGFEAHVDDTGVFVLQLTGEKIWAIGQTQVTRPIAGEHGGKVPEHWHDAADTVRLLPGDLLYIPRGVPHAARAETGQSSLHITLTVAEVSWAQAVASEEAQPVVVAPGSPMRDLLPVGFHKYPGFEAEFLSRLPNSDGAAPEAFMERHARRFAPDLAGRFAATLALQEVTTASRFRARQDVFWWITPKGAERHLICGPIRLAFPDRAEPLVRHLLTRGGALDHIDTDLTQAEQLEIATALLKHNLIRRA